jgi:hypothetical protein
VPSDASLRDSYEKRTGYELHWRGGSFLAAAENAVERAVSRSTIKLQRDVVIDLNRNAYPPASEPGKVPHTRTGLLAASIDFETYRSGGDFTGRVGTNVKYGRWLEEGWRVALSTHNRAEDGWGFSDRTRPRPYLRPALDRMLPGFKEDLKAAGERMSRGK